MVLIMAGDISSKPRQLGDFIVDLAKHYMHIVVLPGNHEFYGQIREYQVAIVNQVLADTPNVTYTGLTTASLEFDNVTIVAGTLWADGGHSPTERFEVSRCLRDFYVIHDEVILDEAPYVGKKLFTVDQMTEDNARFKSEFLELISKAHPEKRLICASHHLPTYELCHPRFGNMIDGGFACKFDELLQLARTPDVWIFGHTHDTNWVQMYGIQFASNPSGYRGEFFSERKKQFNSYGAHFLILDDEDEIRNE